RIEPTRQPRHFIVRTDFQALGQIALAFGNILDAVYHLLQADKNGARYVPGSKQEKRQTKRCQARGYKTVGAPGGVYIVDVNSGPDDPSPRLEGPDKRNFLHRLILARFRPHVKNKTPAWVLGSAHHFNEHRFAGGIFEGGEIFAIQFGL